MEFNIYHVFEGNLVTSTVKLLEKIYLSGKNCIFFSPITERVNLMDKALWAFSTNAFIPHGDKNLGFQDQQSIYFTDTYDNPNNATVLVMMDTVEYSNFNGEFEKIMIVFEDTSLIEDINNFYGNLKKNLKNVNYWKQSAKSWERV
jgi:DNA polymerase-3 subunit chi